MQAETLLVQAYINQDEKAFLQAIQRFQGLQMKGEVARARLGYAEYLIQQGRGREALKVLKQVKAFYQTVGHRPYLEKIRSLYAIMDSMR